MDSWCHVKFVGDNSTVNLPTFYIKEVVEKVLTPSQLKERSFYSVFWSPNPGETPMSLKEQGNEIIDIDDLSEKEKERLKKRNGGPLAGYYKAMLLDLRSTEDSFHDTGSKQTTSAPKRVIMPSVKAFESSQNPGTTGVKPPRSSAKLAKLQAAEASKVNLAKLLETFKKPDSKKELQETEDSLDSSASSSEGESSHEKDSVMYWKKKFEEMKAKKESKKKSKKTKSSKSKADFATLYKSSLNKAMIASSKSSKEPALPAIKGNPKYSQGTQEHSQTIKKDYKATGTDREEPVGLETDDTPKSPQIIEEGSLTIKKDSKATATDKEEPVGLEIDDKPESPQVIEEDSLTNKKDSKANAVTKKEDSSDDEGFSVEVKKRKVRAGPAGDSLFVMNEALKLWGHEIVATRSPTGLAQSRKGSKNELGYPKMTPEKVNAISTKLHDRIVAEGVGKKELKSRQAKLQYYLGQRVSSSRRSLKLKGVLIPSPEELHAQRQQATPKDPKDREEADKET